MISQSKSSFCFEIFLLLRMFRYWLLFFIIASALTGSAQTKALHFSIIGKRVKAIYKTGDEFSFRLKGGNADITSTILDFSDSTIVFQYYQVKISEIDKVRADEKIRSWYMLKYKYDKAFTVAGVGFLALDVANTGDFNRNTLITSGSLILAGVLARIVVKKWIKLNYRRRLTIINT